MFAIYLVIAAIVVGGLWFAKHHSRGSSSSGGKATAPDKSIANIMPTHSVTLGAGVGVVSEVSSPSHESKQHPLKGVKPTTTDDNHTEKAGNDNPPQDIHDDNFDDVIEVDNTDPSLLDPNVILPPDLANPDDSSIEPVDNSSNTSL